MKQIIMTLQTTLNNFVKDYQSNPIKYFYEEDIRANLLSNLVNNELLFIDLPISENNMWLKDYIGDFGNKVKISGIKAEYPSNIRFDIAYINPSIDNNIENHYILNCKFAIEIKLSQKDNYNASFKSNIKKLQDYKSLHPDFTGIAINFEQNPLYDKEKLIKDYTIKFNDCNDLEIYENHINYFIVSKNFILCGRLK